MPHKTVTGPFDVKTLPQPNEADAGDAFVSRLLLDKHFHGPLSGTSKGQMLACGGTQGWGVYVAMERVVGLLDGHSGSFVLYHSGTMDADGQYLTNLVAPGSATGELTGLTGVMKIENRDGAHSYSFDYALPVPS